jgi:hypothetical protein
MPRAELTIAFPRNLIHPQSSSVSRRTASHCGFFDLSQTFDGPDRYGESIRFETMPSRPNRQHCRAIVSQMLIEPDRCTAARQHLGEAGFAVDQFLVPQIVTLPFDQVERDQGDVIVATGAQRVEIGNAVIPANNCLAIGSGTMEPQAAAASTMRGNRSAHRGRLASIDAPGSLSGAP